MAQHKTRETASPYAPRGDSCTTPDQTRRPQRHFANLREQLAASGSLDNPIELCSNKSGIPDDSDDSSAYPTSYSNTLNGIRLPTRLPIHRETPSTQDDRFLKQELQFSDYHWKQIKRLDSMVYLMQTQWMRNISVHMPKLIVSDCLNYPLVGFYEKYYSIRPMWTASFEQIAKSKTLWDDINSRQEKIDYMVNSHKNDEGDDDNSNQRAKKILVLKSEIESYSKGLRKHNAEVAKYWEKLSEQSRATLVQWKEVEAEMKSKGLLECIQDDVSYFKYCIFDIYNSATHYKNTGTDANSFGRHVNDKNKNDENIDDNQNGCLEGRKVLQILPMLDADSHHLCTLEDTHDVIVYRSDWIDQSAKPAARQFLVQDGYEKPRCKRTREDADEDKIRTHDCGFLPNSKKPRCRG